MTLTANYTTSVMKIAVNEGGTMVVCISNLDGDGKPISESCLEIPPTDASAVQHSKTGDTGINPSADLLAAEATLRTQVDILLAAVIAAGKHAL